MSGSTPNFEKWLQARGPGLADQLARERNAICRVVSGRLERTFPELCDDPERPDRESFRRSALERSPERLHTLLQTALRLQTLSVVEQEYRWLLGVLPRYGITARHMLAMAGWYFSEARARLALDPIELAGLNELKRAVLRAIRAETAAAMGGEPPDGLTG